jgi:hypothetical protein
MIARSLIVALAMACAACGARSGLTLPGEGRGEGGAGGPSTSSGPGAGGSGGFSVGGSGGCEIVATDPVVSIAGGSGFHQRQPALSFAGPNDGVTVASEWFVVEGPMSPPSELRHTSFLPWGDSWPSDGSIAPSFLADLDAGVSFAAAPSQGERLALFMSDGGKPAPPAGALFSPDFVPGSGALPAKITIQAAVDRVLFSALRAGGSPEDSYHLLGMELLALSRVSLLATARETRGGIEVAGPITFACADTPTSADAVASEGGWLVASSMSSAAVTGCLNPGPTGPPDMLIVARVDLDAGFVIVGALSSDIVERVRVAPDGVGGASVAWSTLGGRILVMRVDAFGMTLLEPVDIVAPGDTILPASLAIAPYGDRLLVAYVRARTDNPNDIVVRVLDDQARPLFETTLQPLAMEGDPLSVLAHRPSDAFLVAYTESTPEGARIRVVRFSCR